MRQTVAGAYLPVGYIYVNVVDGFRYILQMNVMDHAGSFWITAFNEVAEQIMTISANDLQAMKVSRGGGCSPTDVSRTRARTANTTPTF